MSEQAKGPVQSDALGALRLKLGKDLNLTDESKWAPLWVIDFPLMSYDEAEKRLSGFEGRLDNVAPTQGTPELAAMGEKQLLQ